MKKFLLLSTSLTACTLFASLALANPDGGVVSGGTTTIENSANRVDIRQSSDRAVIDWRSFNIDKGETTQFHQPSSSSLTVNRINDSNPSRILGTMKANGNVVLINKSGISFGKDAVVDVNSLVATTSNISNADAMAGNMNFQGVGAANAAIINEGKITAHEAGLVGLVAPRVENSGVINARLGKVHLASGDRFTVDLYGDGALNITASDAMQEQLISNSGTIKAEGGVVQITAAAGAELVSSIVELDGEIKTPNASEQGGRIIISGNDDTSVSISGSLDASGLMGGNVSITGKNIIQQGKVLANSSSRDGGSVDIKFKNVYLDSESSSVEAKASGGNGGTISVKGSTGSRAFVSGKYGASSSTAKGGKIQITAAQGDLKLHGAKVKAEGKTGGGKINIGGEYQGGGALEHALNTSINFATVLSADVTGNGKGGDVIVWSDEETRFGGTALARGGTAGGNGGLIELSSKDTLLISNEAVTTAAARKSGYQAGQLLLDPKNITIATGGISNGVSYFEFLDPNPDAGLFGHYNGYKVLNNGNVVISDYEDDLIATNSGAVYMFNGATGGLISTLTGSRVDDMVGSGGVTLLKNGNYVISSPSWDNVGMADVGAITWGSMTTGINGPVSATNSFIGSAAGHALSSVYALANGNYLMADTRFDYGGKTSVGFVAWGNGNGGTVGPISLSNALMGSQDYDYLGWNGIHTLDNGDYIITSPYWNNGGTADVGAVTFGNGATGGPTGIISASNSIIGSRMDDMTYVIINQLSNGNIVLGLPNWDNGGNADAGALAFINAGTGRAGAITSSNAFIGSRPNDQVGNGMVLELGNGKFAAVNADWDNNTTVDAGAVVMGSTTTGGAGVISAANALVGTSTGDRIGSGSSGYGDGLVKLTNNNFLVVSPDWNRSGAITQAGAVTWVSGITGRTGAVSSTNSLVGSQAGDRVGSTAVAALSNGNYVVGSEQWDSSTMIDVGAITWGNGLSGIFGDITVSNSLLGSTASDGLGRFTVFDSGNYLILSPFWDNASVENVGAITLANGLTGLTGYVTAGNSMIGTTEDDQVGSGGAMSVGSNNFVVFSSAWDNGSVVDSGAVTWISESTGTHGVVSTSNSLYSTVDGSTIGSNGGRVLTNGNYLIFSPSWSDGVAVNAGAVTWGNGATGTTGAVNASNSMVGSHDNDSVGGNPGWDDTELANGNYLIMTPFWNDGRGAVTWGNGATGTSGVVGVSNSVIGSQPGDQVGWEDWWDETIMDNGDYVLHAIFWGNGTPYSGAIMIIDGTNGTAGEITADNAFLNDSWIWPRYWWDGDFEDHVNDRYVINDDFNHKVYSIDLNRPRLPDYNSYGDMAGANVTMSPEFITNVLNSGTSVTLQANNDITLSDDLIVNNNLGDGGTLTFQAGRSILLNANIYTDNGDLNLFANEDLATGVVNAHRDAGNAVINMGTNATIDAGTGTVTMRLDDGAGKTNRGAGDIILRDITAGTIFARNMNTTGDIIIEAGTLTATNVGDAITLVSGRNFIINSVVAPFDATTGRWLVYSTNPDQDTIGSIGQNFRRFSCTYGGSCPSMPGGTNNGLLYSYTPILDITPTALAAIQYGDAIPSLNGYAYGVTGYLDSDAADDIRGGSLNGTTTYTVGSGVNTYNINYGSGALTSAMGYGFNYLNNASAITVNKKDITASFNSTLTKVYGNANPTVNYNNFTFAGLVGSDNASLFTSITPNFGAVGVNTDVSVGNAVTAAIGSTTNYNITNTPATTLSITPRALNVSTNSTSKILPAGDPAFTGSHNLTAFDAGQVSWVYAPVGYGGLDGTYTISATATDPSSRLSNYTRSNTYGSFVVHPVGTVIAQPTPEPEMTMPNTVVYMGLGGYLRDIQGNTAQPLTSTETASVAAKTSEKDEETLESQLILTDVEGEQEVAETNKSFISIHPRLKAFLMNPFAMLVN